MSSNGKRRWEKFKKDKDYDSSSSSDGEISCPVKKTQPLPVDRDFLVPIGSIISPYCVDPSRAETGTDNTPIGPALPPHLVNASRAETGTDNTPIGPALPPHLVDASSVVSESDITPIGPVLPAHLFSSTSTANKNIRTIGPTLPPHLDVFPSDFNEKTEPCTSKSSKKKILGPDLPHGFLPPVDFNESSSEDETFGPDPRLMLSGEHSVGGDIAERAERTRKKMLGLEDKKPVRESWMLELPPEKAANIGLGPRQFRAKLAPEMGDRSVWTDTPSDTERKERLPPQVDHKTLIKKQVIAERDHEMEKMAKKAEKKLKREESLLAMHEKKTKSKAKEETNEPKERKRFNREEDMQVHRFDEAQKKAIFKKAQLLNDRFSRGESKYL